MALFSDFQYGFRSSRSTSDLLTAVSDGISRALNSFRVTQALALNISKAFDRVWHAGFHKLKFYGILGEVFGLILFYFIFSGFDWFWMGSFHKNIQLMLDFLKTILGPTLFLLYINDLDDVICNIAVYADTIISIRPGGE